MISEAAETPSSQAELVFQLFLLKFPHFEPRFIAGKTPIIVFNKFLEFQGPEIMHFYDFLDEFCVGDSRKEMPPGFEALRGINARRLGYGELIGNESGDRRIAFEITLSSGGRLFLLPQDEYQALGGGSIRKKTDDMESLIEQWFQKNQSHLQLMEQRKASKVLTGEYAYIIPILAGLKPVAWITKEKDPTVLESEKWEFLEYIQREMPEQFRIVCINEDVFLVNPSVLSATLNRIFFHRHYDINDGGSLEDILKKVFGSNGRKFDDTISKKAQGYLLGYDKTSVSHFSEDDDAWQRESTSPFPNVWGQNYQVFHPERNKDFQKLRDQYDWLLHKIEELIGQGLSPLEVLKILPQTEVTNQIRRLTRRRIRRTKV